MDGLDLVRRVYVRLRKPSQEDLPWQTVLETVQEVVARRRLELSLSDQNLTAETSQWFVPPDTDFQLSDVGIDCLLPIRMERRSTSSTEETGRQVPIVNYDVLDTATAEAVSFYGDPMRVVFRASSEMVFAHEYRLVFEPDFQKDAGLETVVGLPEFFKYNIVLESAYRLLDVVEDSSPEWMQFFKMASERWEKQLMADMPSWERYVRQFRGRAAVPKRNYFSNRDWNRYHRTRYFKG